MRDLLIGGRRIADDTEAYVVAHIGTDAWGDLERTEVLFLRAAMSGAVAVLLDAEALYPLTRYDEAPGEPYRNRVPSDGQWVFGRSEYARLARMAADLDLDLVPTAFDKQSVEFLRELDVEPPAIRLGPDALTDLALVAEAAELRRPLLLTVRDATAQQVRLAVDEVRRHVPGGRAARPRVALLQCAQPEPHTAADLNLARLVTLLSDFPELVIGFSGEHVCPEQTWITYAIGARIVERAVPADRHPAARRRMTLDPLGLIRYDGRNRWGDHSDGLRING